MNRGGTPGVCCHGPDRAAGVARAQCGLRPVAGRRRGRRAGPRLRCRADAAMGRDRVFGGRRRGPGRRSQSCRESGSAPTRSFMLSVRTCGDWTTRDGPVGHRHALPFRGSPCDERSPSCSHPPRCKHAVGNRLLTNSPTLAAAASRPKTARTGRARRAKRHRRPGSETPCTSATIAARLRIKSLQVRILPSALMSPQASGADRPPTQSR